MLLIMEVGVWRDVEVVVVGDVVARGHFARALVWGDVCQSPRGPKLTAAAQAPLQLNCCNTGSSTAASCCHKGCPQRLRYRSRRGSLNL